MSTIFLRDPVLGKRKSIDPCRYDHDSSDKHEAILGEKKDAAVGEKENEEAKQEALLVDKEEPILGEKEDDDLDYEGLRKELADRTAKILEEMKQSGKKFINWGPALKCRICLSDHFSCPWDGGSYAEELEDLPTVTSRYRLVCSYCRCTKFEKKHPRDFVTCEACFNAKICAVDKIAHDWAMGNCP